MSAACCYIFDDPDRHKTNVHGKTLKYRTLYSVQRRNTTNASHIDNAIFCTGTSKYTFSPVNQFRRSSTCVQQYTGYQVYCCVPGVPITRSYISLWRQLYNILALLCCCNLRREVCSRAGQHKNKSAACSSSSSSRSSASQPTKGQRALLLLLVYHNSTYSSSCTALLLYEYSVLTIHTTAVWMDVGAQGPTNKTFCSLNM